MTIRLFSLILFLVLALSCEISVPKSPKLKGKKVEVIYLGNVPCSDCDHIETFVELHKNQTYVVSRRYMGKEDNIQFEDKGKYNWIGDGTIIHLLDFDGPSYYKADGTNLYQLDSNMQVHLGMDKYSYRFEKNALGATNY